MNEDNSQILVLKEFILLRFMIERKTAILVYSLTQKEWIGTYLLKRELTSDLFKIDE